MLYHNQCIAQIPQLDQGVKEAIVVPLVETNAGFI